MDPWVADVIQAVVTAVSILVAAVLALQQLRQERANALQQLIQERELFLKTLSDQQQQRLRASLGELLSERREIVLESINDPVTASWLLDQFGFKDKGFQGNQGKLYLYSFLMIDHYQHVYYRYKRGLFPRELWPMWRSSMDRAFATDVFKDIYASSFQHAISNEFKEFIKSGFTDFIPESLFID